MKTKIMKTGKLTVKIPVAQKPKEFILPRPPSKYKPNVKMAYSRLKKLS